MLDCFFLFFNIKTKFNYYQIMQSVVLALWFHEHFVCIMNYYYSNFVYVYQCTQEFGNNILKFLIRMIYLLETERLI